MVKKYSGGHIALDYMKPSEIIVDTAAIGLMAFLGCNFTSTLDSIAASSGIYASVNDIVRDKSDGNGISSYTTRAIRRSVISGIISIGIKAATSPAQNSNEYFMDVGLTAGLYLGGLLLSPLIRNGPKLLKRTGRSLIKRLTLEDSRENTFTITDE